MTTVMIFFNKSCRGFVVGVGGAKKRRNISRIKLLWLRFRSDEHLLHDLGKITRRKMEEVIGLLKFHGVDGWMDGEILRR